MNERIQELAEQAGINCVVPAVGSLEYSSKGEIEHLKKFAELIYKDIITVVAAQALSNESALDVFKNLKRIYEDGEA